MDNNVTVETNNIDIRSRILSQKDLYDILPFGKTKVKQLLRSGELPLVKMGSDYVTTFDILQDWLKSHVGQEIYYY